MDQPTGTLTARYPKPDGTAWVGETVHITPYPRRLVDLGTGSGTLAVKTDTDGRISVTLPATAESGVTYTVETFIPGQRRIPGVRVIAGQAVDIHAPRPPVINVLVRDPANPGLLLLDGARRDSFGGYYLDSPPRDPARPGLALISGATPGAVVRDPANPGLLLLDALARGDTGDYLLDTLTRDPAAPGLILIGA